MIALAVPARDVLFGHRQSHRIWPVKPIEATHKNMPNITHDEES